MSYRHRLARKPATKKKKNKKGNIITRFFWGIIKLGIQASVVGLAIFAAIVYFFSTQIPPLEDIIDGRYNGSVTFLDRHGEVFAWRGDQFDASLRAGNASQNLLNAVIATEDKRYYKHFGISPRSLARALTKNYKENGNPFKGEGGSTLTTQVAKLICLGAPYDPSAGTYAEYENECRRSTLERKLKEIPYAMALEFKFTKEEILSIYLNRAYLGAGTYGFGAAAKRYFDIPASGLNVAQSAMLAGMLTAPSRFAPTNNLQRSQDRGATVVRLMREQGYITQAQSDDAMANPATLSRKAQSDEGIFFADWLMKDQPDFLTSQTSEDIIYRTTFDPKVQKIAQAAIDKIFETKVRPGSKAQAAVVIMDKTGAVRAMIGGRFDEDRVEQGFNRAVDAKRQPGSSFKPFVYAAALESGLRPYNTFLDAPLTIKLPAGKTWKPKNYSGNFRGRVNMIKAMEQSINTVAVLLQEEAGRKRVQTLAHEMGIQSALTGSPSLALGVSEVNLLELTSAYAGILNRGKRITPYGWIHTGYKNTSEIIMTHEPTPGPQVLDDKKAGWLIYMMKNVVDNGTGQRAKISGHQIAGKTGTTNEAKDAWFVGFSGNYVAGVWMGYDDNTPLQGVTGGGLPAEIWHEAMAPLLAQTGSVDLPMVVPTAPPPPAPTPTPTPAAPSNDAQPNIINDLLNLLLN